MRAKTTAAGVVSPPSSASVPVWAKGTPAHLRQSELLGEIARLYGDEARRPPATYLRLYGTAPPGRGGTSPSGPRRRHGRRPRHATHEPPFCVCGSDQWGAGHREAAVRTARDTAEEVPRRG
ncbi:hypothetical protein ACFXG6_19630 [Streptomyces roseus]|uniref:hypothetical protein n=1 Tax=Streptomyces roseus TaxID=66430 RepID=UPI0036B0AC80